MRKLHLLFLLIAMCSGPALIAQEEEDDLLSLLGDDDFIDYTIATFKANRVINLHSVENTSPGVLDFKISHRFGRVNGGASELFGLDQSTIRFGFDYGITDWLMIGVGRSSFEKTYDGLIKFRLLRQSTGGRKMPVTANFFASTAIKSTPWEEPDRINYFTSRMFYTFQLIVGRKFSERLSLQVSPTLVHRNLVATAAESNDVYAIGGAGRYKLSNRFTITGEYIYVLPDQLAEQFYNALSLGVNIETGGHVFQLHFTNSLSMIEKGFVTETRGQWGKGDIHFGFNISRVFNVGAKNKKH